MKSKRFYEDWISAFMEYSKYVEAPEVYLRWSAVSVVSAALERKVWLRSYGYTHYPNLYIFLVGEAGIRKSSASGRAVSLLWEVPGIGKLSNKLNEASLLRDLALVGETKKVEVGGITYPTSSGYLYASEGSDVFKAMYKDGGVIEVLTSLYDGGGPDKQGWSENSPWVKSTMGGGMTALHNPVLSFLACTTPSSLPVLINRTEAEGGFGSRTLLVVFKGRVEKSYEWKEEVPADFEMRLRLIHDLRQINLMQGAYQPDSQYKKLLPALERMHDEYMAEKRSHSLVAGFLARKITHATKLSQVIAASSSSDLTLRASHLEQAWRMLNELEPTMLEAYGSMGVPEDMRIRDDVWAHILKTKQTKFIKADIQVAFQEIYPPKKITAALDELRELGKIRYEPMESRSSRHVYSVLSGDVLGQSSLSLGL